MQQEKFWELQTATSYIAKISQAMNALEQGKQVDEMKLNGALKQFEEAKRQSDNKPKNQILKADLASFEANYKNVVAEVNNNTTERNKELADLERRLKGFKEVEVKIIEENFPQSCWYKLDEEK